MDYKNQVLIIMPAFNPDYKMIDLIKELKGKGLKNILIVDDGSKDELKHYFYEAQSEYGCRILTHAVNLGKGRALKNAFNCFLTEYTQLKGCVTIDADGQHSSEDILRCAEELINHPNHLVLGCREFDGQDIPLRSKLGNKVTRNVTKLICGKQITDTQTGLRAIPKDMISELIGIPGERYEYEMNMLLEAVQKDWNISEVKIKTIYIEENESSHFRPIVDSLKIYSVFLKFLFSSGLSFVVDISVFTLSTKLLGFSSMNQKIIFSTLLARIISSLLNYKVNKNIVFKSSGNSKESLIKYYILCVIQMACSAILVASLYKVLKIDEVIIKVIVDALLFMISFRIQKIWVFSKRTDKGEVNCQIN